MQKRKIIIIIILCLILFLVFTGITIFFSINPQKDNVQNENIPEKFYIINNDNYIDYQSDNQCSAYAVAYVMRHMGKQINGAELHSNIRRVFGFVSPNSVAKFFWEYDYNAKAYHGNISTLKKRISDGVPVIVFVSIPNDTHYVVVVGYDEEYLYLVDSLSENSNVNGKWYNRKISTLEFEKIWNTNTVLSNNIYIVITSA